MSVCEAYHHTTTFRQITRCDVEGGWGGGQIITWQNCKKQIIRWKISPPQAENFEDLNIIRWRTLLLGAFQDCSKLLSIEEISLCEFGILGARWLFSLVKYLF